MWTVGKVEIGTKEHSGFAPIVLPRVCARHLSSGEFCAWSPSYNFRACNGILYKTAVQIHGSCLLTFPRHCVRFQCKEPGSAALRGGAWLLQTKGMEDSMPPALSLEQMLGVKQATKCWFLDDNFMQQQFHRSSRSASFCFCFSSKPVPPFHAPIGKMVKQPRILTAWCPDSEQHCGVACSCSGTARDVQMFLHYTAWHNTSAGIGRQECLLLDLDWKLLSWQRQENIAAVCKPERDLSCPYAKKKAFCSFFPDYFEGQRIY